MWVKKQQLKLDMEQQLVPNWERSTAMLYFCHLSHLTYMQGTSCEIPGWMKHNLESRLPGEISITSDMHDTTLTVESKEEIQSLLMKSKEETEKAGLKLNIKKKRQLIHHFMGNRWGNNGNNDRLYFLGFQSHFRL